MHEAFERFHENVLTVSEFARIVCKNKKIKLMNKKIIKTIC